MTGWRGARVVSECLSEVTAGFLRHGSLRTSVAVPASLDPWHKVPREPRVSKGRSPSFALLCWSPAVLPGRKRGGRGARRGPARPGQLSRERRAGLCTACLRQHWQAAQLRNNCAPGL